MIAATSCICGKHMLEAANEGTCLSCGHGDARVIAEHAYHRNMQRPAVRDAIHDPPRRRGGRRADWTDDDCIAAARAWERAHGRLPSSLDWQQPRNGAHRPSYPTILRTFGGWRGFMNAVADVPREQTLAAA